MDEIERFRSEVRGYVDGMMAGGDLHAFAFSWMRGPIIQLPHDLLFAAAFDGDLRRVRD